MPEADRIGSRKKTVTYRIIRERKYAKLEEKIIENLVELQKVHVKLAERFDSLSKEISELLTLFEVAAKNFAEGEGKTQYDKDKDFLDKIDELLEQNKTIAKGLSLMEDRLKGKSYSAESR